LINPETEAEAEADATAVINAMTIVQVKTADQDPTSLLKEARNKAKPTSHSNATIQTHRINLEKIDSKEVHVLLVSRRPPTQVPSRRVVNKIKTLKNSDHKATATAEEVAETIVHAPRVRVIMDRKLRNRLSNEVPMANSSRLRTPPFQL
jgi:hypothetical protein